MEIKTYVSFLQVGYTSARGLGGILAQREFDMRFSADYVNHSSFQTIGMVIVDFSQRPRPKLPVKRLDTYSFKGVSLVVLFSAL